MRHNKLRWRKSLLNSQKIIKESAIFSWISLEKRFWCRFFNLCSQMSILLLSKTDKLCWQTIRFTIERVNEWASQMCQPRTTPTFFAAVVRWRDIHFCADGQLLTVVVSTGTAQRLGQIGHQESVEEGFNLWPINGGPTTQCRWRMATTTARKQTETKKKKKQDWAVMKYDENSVWLSDCIDLFMFIVVCAGCKERSLIWTV